MGHHHITALSAATIMPVIPGGLDVPYNEACSGFLKGVILKNFDMIS